MKRQLEIHNVYELYDDVITHVEVDLQPPSDFATDDDYQEHLDDEIFPHTGVGHTDGNSAYFVTSTDGLEPPIEEEYGT